MFVLCDVNNPVYPCTGVVGGATRFTLKTTADTTVENFNMNLINLNYEQALRDTDTCTNAVDKTQCLCSDFDVNTGITTKLGFYDNAGWCIKESIGHNVLIKETSRFVVGSSKDSYYNDSKSYSFDDFDNLNYQETMKISKEFPLDSVHKVWGGRQSPNNVNKGVFIKNVK